jgi:hypothetical protein
MRRGLKGDVATPLELALDEIDRALARHYSLTDEGLDFIINHDIKYRMSRGAGETEEGTQ